MSTTLQNLDDMTRGDNVTITVTCPSAIGDLSGGQVSCTWRDDKDAIVFTRKNLAAGGDAAQAAITSGGPPGVFAVYIVPANTTELLIRTGVAVTLRYDMQVTTAAGNVHTVLAGTMRVAGDATR